MSRNQQIRLFSALAIRAPFTQLEATWLTQHPDNPLAIDWGPTTAIEKKLAAGEPADAVIVTVKAMDKLIAEGVVTGGSRVELVDSPIGLAMLPQAEAPDISSVEALKKALLAARSVCWSLGGASGIYFQTVLKQLGIEEAMAARATTIGEGFTASQLIAGKADIAVQQISELLAVKGIKVIGPLPDAVQQPTSISAGVLANAQNPQGAAALLDFLRSAEAGRAFEAFGMSLRN
ncbi:substrate-binding domain-containing protein [Pantoea sp. CCBC3-3-1]|uniref:molybdate ABC transporter substrate-binding protein n=1 Tax=Pantoea sp. CCBC3-3-1 TaxID=2490851 RepID=UPI0011BED713|nr:substrate-binding domain-containing protein [Pantoea sp. CCBC3-3-1]